MRTLQILAREHAAIAALIDRFEAEVDRIVRLGDVDGEAVDRLLQFFEVQVDGHHQEKEERVFLPRLLTRATGEDVPLLRSLFDDHGRQRRLLAHMRAQIEGVSYCEPNCIAALARSARTYVREQREHSRWEQAVLFPIAARILRPRDDRAMLNGFRRLDEMYGRQVWDEANAVVAWLDQRGSLVPA